MAAQLDRPVGELEVLNRAPEVLYPQAERPPGPVVGHHERYLRVDYDLRRVTEIESGLAELVGDALRDPAGGVRGHHALAIPPRAMKHVAEPPSLEMHRSKPVAVRDQLLG